MRRRPAAAPATSCSRRLREYGRHAARRRTQRVELFTAHAAHFAAEAAIVERGSARPPTSRDAIAAGRVVVRRSARRAALRARGRRPRRRVRAHQLDPRVRDARDALRGVRLGRRRVPALPAALDHPLAPIAHRHARVRRVGSRRVRARRRARHETRRRSRPLRGRRRAGSPSGCSANVLYIVGADRRRALVEMRPSGRARRGVGQPTRGWCTPATWRRSRSSSIGEFDDARPLVAARARGRRDDRAARPTSRRPRSRRASPRHDDDRRARGVRHRRPARPLGRQPLDERLRPHRGERAARASRRRRRGLRGSRRDGRRSGTAPASGRSSGTRCRAA